MWNFEMSEKRTNNEINEKIINHGTTIKKRKIRKEKVNWWYSLVAVFFVHLLDDTCAYVKNPLYMVYMCIFDCQTCLNTEQ